MVSHLKLVTVAIKSLSVTSATFTIAEGCPYHVVTFFSFKYLSPRTS